VRVGQMYDEASKHLKKCTHSTDSQSLNPIKYPRLIPSPPHSHTHNNKKSYAGTKEIGPFHKCFSSVVGCVL
jgi:hypothetical protein